MTTLSEASKLAQDMLVPGVIENVITTNDFFRVLPFMGIRGNSLAYNRENALADVDVEGVGDTIGGVSLATYTGVSASLTTIIGDAGVNGLINSTQSGTTNQTAVQIASKAKSAGRKYQDMLINGTGAANQFGGLASLVSGGQTIASTGANGDALSFEVLDNLMDLVKDKDGQVDYFCMPTRTRRSYFALLRALGGASIGDTVMLPDGTMAPAYRGVPIFANDWIALDGAKGSATTLTEVYCGTLDDGSHSVGISGLTSEEDAGIQVVDVGESETKDEHIWRVKWYCGLALFSDKGLAVATGITN